MAEDELFCERPAKMANFRLAFDTRTKNASRCVGKRTERDPELQILRLDFCAALRHDAANQRETVASGAARGNIGGGRGFKLAGGLG